MVHTIPKNADPLSMHHRQTDQIDWLFYPFGMFFGDCIEKPMARGANSILYPKIIIIFH